MRLIASALRVFAFLFHLTIGTFLLMLAAIAAWRHGPLAIGLMPFEDAHLLSGTALMGAAGIGCSLLSLTRTFRFVFVIWTVGFLYLLLRSFAEGAFDLETSSVVRGLHWLTWGAAGAMVGALRSVKTRRAPSRFWP